jgi:hypothetical protein
MTAIDYTGAVVVLVIFVTVVAQRFARMGK